MENALKETICRYLTIKSMASILIVLFSLIGCTDVPYTGPMLTVDHVDRYLNAIGEDTICLQDGFDSVCIRVIPEKTDDTDNIPTVHVHPTSLIFIFHYEDKIILRAERVMDTTQIVHDLTEEHTEDSSTQDNNSNIFRSWTIQIYYPDSFPDVNRGETPETSGLNIRIVEGNKISPDNRADLRIKQFIQINGLDSSRIAQFSIETQVPEITIQLDGLIPDHTATFHINADKVTSNQGSGNLQLQPL